MWNLIHLCYVCYVAYRLTLIIMSKRESHYPFYSKTVILYSMRRHIWVKKITREQSSVLESKQRKYHWKIKMKILCIIAGQAFFYRIIKFMRFKKKYFAKYFTRTFWLRLVSQKTGHDGPLLTMVKKIWHIFFD